VGTTRAEVANVIGGRRYVLEEGQMREVTPGASPVPAPSPPRAAAAAGDAPMPQPPDLFTPPATGGA
jgi:hypothetical protein